MNKNKKIYSKVEENVDKWRGAANLDRGDNMWRTKHQRQGRE